MSFRRSRAIGTSDAALDLMPVLQNEFEHPSDNAENPVIIGEPPDPTKPIDRLYVIWDAWDDLDLRERSELIMDAYTAAKGVEAAMKISVAMGLTTKEARRMNIGTN
jgi:hypothetical protein